MKWQMKLLNTHCGLARRGSTILPDLAVIFSLFAGYYSAFFGSNISAICGYYSAFFCSNISASCGILFCIFLQ
jgi:hypothetical protein